MGVEGIDPRKEEVSTDEGFGKKVEDFLDHIRTRLGDVIYNSFGSIDNFYNLFLKIEQYAIFYDKNSNNEAPLFIGTYREKGKYGFVKPTRENGEIKFDKEKPKYDKIYSEGGYFIVEKKVEKKTKKGLFNDKLEEMLPLEYDEIKVIDNHIFYKEGDYRLMMDENKNILINSESKITELISLGYHVVIIKSENDKFGLLSTKDGKIKVNPKYDEYRVDFPSIVFKDTSRGESCSYNEPIGDAK